MRVNAGAKGQDHYRQYQRLDVTLSRRRLTIYSGESVTVRETDGDGDNGNASASKVCGDQYLKRTIRIPRLNLIR